MLALVIGLLVAAPAARADLYSSFQAPSGQYAGAPPAGGHLALMVAVRRRDVACVVSDAAPTRLARLHGRLLADAHRFFDGAGGLSRWSPASYRIDIQIVLGHATADRTVSYHDAIAMARRALHSRVVLLPPGDVAWTHAAVDAGSLARLDRIERAVLRRAASQTGAGASATSSASDAFAPRGTTITGQRASLVTRRDTSPRSTVRSGP
jgi:hypothetical protein